MCRGAAGSPLRPLERRYVVFNMSPFKKKLAAVLVSSSVAFSAACAAGEAIIRSAHAAEAAPSAVVAQTELPSPFTPCSSLEEMSSRLGFTVQLPASLADRSIKALNVLSGDTAQIDFADGSLYRMARGKEDISGDYTRYDVRKSWRADGRRITARGEKDAYRSIIWNDGTYTYAYLTDTPLNRAEATALATGR
mgnify:CR=1 FL=1